MSAAFSVTVEFKIDGAWTDITRIDSDTYVRYPIEITWGRTKDQERMAPAKASFTMVDNNCILDGDLPSSPYYGRIGVGTEARVLVNGAYRMAGEIAVLDPDPGETPQSNYRVVEIAGYLRRLDESSRPVESAAYAAYADPTNSSTRVFYAPLEEESGSATLATFEDKGSITYDTVVNLGADTDTRSSARLLTFGDGGRLEADIPFYVSTEHKVTALMKFPEGGLTNGFVPIRLHTTGGNIDRIHLRFNTPWALTLDAMRGFSIADSAVIVDWTGYIDNNQEFWITLEFTQNGANIDCLVGIIREDGVFGIPTDSLIGCTLGRIWHITVGANDISGSSFGHLAVANDTGAFANYIQLGAGGAGGINGYQGEYADARLFRLLDAAGIVYGNSQATVEDTSRMNTQRPAPIGDLVYECVDTDSGVLIEHRTFPALVYASRFSLQNQAPVARLDWSHVSLPFKPSPADVDLYNDFTVSRDGGGNARYIIEDGDVWHRTTEVPPAGVNSRPGSGESNLYPDSQLDLHAAWRAHVFTASDRAAAKMLQPGDILWLDTTDAPPYVPYTELRFLVQGGAETISQNSHRITLNTTPADIYEVNAVDAEGSLLVAPVTSGGTSIKIAPPEKGPAWTTSSRDTPYNIQVGGQAMRVTAISTDTPAYIGASAAAASGNNASVTPALPAGLTVDTGQLLLIWATIRNSGTGTVNTPTGWTKLVDFGNTAWLAKYYLTGDTAPLVTFTGGVANADTLARMFAFSGLSMVLGSGTKGTPAAHTQLNSSAANIAYPAVTLPRDGAVILSAWKQDDWTSVTTPSGFTPVSADATTTGDDAAIWVGYDLTGVAAIAGSLTVTGGASAISRAVVMGLRPLQTATVTRGIASTATAIAAGAEVHAWRAGVNGL
jgi:hypothetical protein